LYNTTHTQSKDLELPVHCPQRVVQQMRISPLDIKYKLPDNVSFQTAQACDG